MSLYSVLYRGYCQVSSDEVSVLMTFEVFVGFKSFGGSCFRELRGRRGF